MNMRVDKGGVIPWVRVLLLSNPVSLVLQLVALVVAALLRNAPRIICTAVVEEGHRAPGGAVPFHSIGL